ncbi:GNAT family N-acetyltransferase [Streptomyces sp. NPDC051219]|uniref:GNAT family N-acetyltransferase n=1 Tax=Streptomyces sp. NPDC051219 TaxID=3155283 RepID=UPI0034386AF5
MNDIRVRPMRPDDCTAVAEARVRGWQSAYTGLVPQPYLDAMSVEEDTARRRTHLAGAAPGVVNLVAERDGEVVGWACYGPYRDGAADTRDGELYALYVHPGHFSTGAGRALMEETLARAAAHGHPSLLLWVLEENTRARRFYEKAGFAPDGAEESFVVDGVAVPEVRYARRLSACAAASPSRG